MAVQPYLKPRVSRVSLFITFVSTPLLNLVVNPQHYDYQRVEPGPPYPSACLQRDTTLRAIRG
jgi:hypothetical protein